MAEDHTDAESVPEAAGGRAYRLRRLSQWLFVALFFVLLTMTVWPLGRVFLGAFLIADPLIALNSLSGGIAKADMLLALAVAVSPLLLGRAFCGWICPTGAFVELASPKSRAAASGQPRRMGASRLPERVRKVLRVLPTYVLLACAGLLLFGSAVYLLLDPLATLTRTATVILYPVLDRLVRVAGNVAYLAPPLRPSVDAVTTALGGRIVFAKSLTYGLQLWVLGMFAAMLGLSRLEPRLWCRHLCPLGALLGAVGRLAVTGRTVAAEKCIQCGRCTRVCAMDAVSEDHLSTDTTRCQLGMECAAVCPTSAISVGLRPSKAVYSPARRAFLGVAGGSLLVGLLTYLGLSRYERDPRLVRPPGARPEPELLALCSRCGQCMKVCPTNVIQPTATRAGLEGVFTPQMDYDLAYCDWACNECGKVCPTGAIRQLTLDAKRKTRIGRAYVDKNRCIPWADYKTCLVCQELCPVPDKAIALREATVVAPDGRTLTLGRPEVLADRCIGCGVCENNCPVANQSAIQVYASDRERRLA